MQYKIPMCKSGNYEHKSTYLKQTVMNKCQELLSAKINRNRILTMQFMFLHDYQKVGKRVDIEQSWSGVCAYTM